MSERQQSTPVYKSTGDVSFRPQGVNKSFARSKDAVTHCEELFRDVAGHTNITEEVVKYAQIVENARELDMDTEAQNPFSLGLNVPSESSYSENTGIDLS